MARYPFLQVDAFTDRPLGGNPCAVVLDADDLDAAVMQAIAREMNLSETAFVLRPETADFRARYFTPGAEIPLAGHPTIAVGWALLQTGRIADDATHFTLELPAGTVRVDYVRRAGVVELMAMTQLRPRFLAELAADDAMPALGLEPVDLLPGATIQVVSTGTPQLMVPLRDPDALRRAGPDPARYPALQESGGFFGVHVFCLGGHTEAGDTCARHFAPPSVAEDPFTGSATGGMAAFLWRYGWLDEPRFVAEQGHWMDRPGTAHVEVRGPRDAIEAVVVAGGAATIVTGELTLDRPA